MASSLDSVLESLRSSYAAELPEKVRLLRELWKRQEADELRKAAHKLRGSGRSYGFPEISELCAQLEEAAELEDWVGIAQILLNLENVPKDIN